MLPPRGGSITVGIGVETEHHINIHQMTGKLLRLHQHHLTHNENCRLICVQHYDTPDAAAQLQPIKASRLACGAQRALLPVAVGAMNIDDVRDRQRQTDSRQTSDAHHRLMPPRAGA